MTDQKPPPVSTDVPAIWDRPCAMPGLTSYRARGRYGWIMIGARNDADAMREALRSTDRVERLDVWCSESGAYVQVVDHA